MNARPPRTIKGGIRTAIDPVCILDTGVECFEGRLARGHWAKQDFKIQEAFFVDHIKPFSTKLPLPSTSIPRRVLLVLEQRGF